MTSDSTTDSETEADTAGTAAEPEPEPEPDPNVSPELIAEQVINILAQYCSDCHEAPNSNGGIDYITDLQQLVENGVVIPGKPDESRILNRLEAETMPPVGNPSPSEEEVSVIREWIAAGAVVPTPPEECDNPVYSYARLYDEIELDLVGVDNEDQPFIRYLSLHDLYNMGACESTLERGRIAASKLVNSLSTNFATHPPVQTGDGGVLLRIDIRDYNWDSQGDAVDKWEQSLTANPQVVRIDSDSAETVRALTGTDVPVQTLASFLFFSTQPPLYHEMVGIPENLDDLLNNSELDLNVDPDQAIADDILSAAGVVISGVSDQNRVVQRIPIAASRSFWLSFDFASNSGQQSILGNPLDFVADGSEVIFSLPNGLHAYMIVDSNGSRIDRAPTSIVRDPLQPTQEVINGISCMSCHAQGLLPAKDVVRGHVENFPFLFDGETIELVKQLYIPQDEFQLQIDADTAAYHQAIIGAGAELIPSSDPLVQTFLTYDRNLDITQITAELGVSAQNLTFVLSELDANLVSVLEGGRLRRDTFNEIFVDTLCTLNDPGAFVVEDDCL